MKNISIICNIIGIICICLLILIMRKDNITTDVKYTDVNNDDKYITIHQYNYLIAYKEYTDFISRVKSEVIRDLLKNEYDTVFMKNIKFHYAPNLKPQHIKEEMKFMLDSLVINYYQSIPYMYMDDRKYDSTWVHNSDSYKRCNELIETIQNKYKMKYHK